MIAYFLNFNIKNIAYRGSDWIKLLPAPYAHPAKKKHSAKTAKSLILLAGTTRLELATSGVTGDVLGFPATCFFFNYL